MTDFDRLVEEAARATAAAIATANYADAINNSAGHVNRDHVTEWAGLRIGVHVRERNRDIYYYDSRQINCHGIVIHS